jgi:uncharacterized protein (UPF0332 family)
LDGNLCDFAISRAYYAMFYVAQALLEDEGLTFSSHKATIAAFGKHLAKGDEDAARLHRYLIDAQDERLSGDYAVRSGLTADDAREQIEHAVEFIEVARRKMG